MPTYQYACKDCHHHFEQVQAFSDPSLTVCPDCSGPLRKVYGSVGVVFKGSGFYRTDSRSGADKASLAAKHDSSASNDSTSSTAAAAPTKKTETAAKATATAKAPAAAG